MNLITLALKSLRRKKVRSALTVAGVAIAVTVLVSLIGFDAGYQRSLESDIDRMGYQVLVTAKGCPYEAATLMLKGGGGLRYMDTEPYEKIVRDERVGEITPQLVATVYNPDARNGEGAMALFMGIEDSYLRLKPWIEFKEGGWFSGGDEMEVIMGYEAAELEQRKAGDEVFVPGKDVVLKVVGVMERTGTQDDGIMFLPLAAMQRVFELPGKISGIGIKLKDMQDLHRFEEDLYEEPGIQVVSMAQVKGTIFNLMSSAKVMTNAVASVAVLVALLGVMNTVLMSVVDRTREIGVMKALGASRSDVFKLVWIETAIVCVLGGLLGEAIALFGSRGIEALMRAVLPYVPGGRLVELSPGLLVLGIVGALLAGLIAGVYPAFRASGLKPVQAIRGAE